MIFARLFEDAVLVARFSWFFYKAPEEAINRHVGFVAQGEKLPLRSRTVWAWKRATSL